MTLGLTNGSTNYGICPNGGSNMIIGWTGLYGTNVGSTPTGSYTGGNNALGIATDSSKSGITARPSIKSLSAYVFYCIKY